MARTKIVCTIGPASKSKTVLRKMIKAGMNVARLNFSHGTHADHKNLMRTIRSASHELKKPITILQDLQGPRIRLGELGDKGITLKKNQKVIFTTAAKPAKGHIPVTYNKLHKDMNKGERLLLVDGLIEVHVDKIAGHDIYGTVKIGGLIETHKGINLPETNVSIPALTEKDKEDVLFGVEQGVDFMALSFVRQAKDVHQLRKYISYCEKKLKIKSVFPIQIIVKVERKEAIDNLDEIIAATDGIMVARGDLGIELPAEDVPLMQKMIIDHCMEAAKPVIVATQMLDSMIHNPRPTRAEASDVANAVIDHADATMLSGESASGKYPVESVDYMTRIIEKTEASEYDDLVVQAYADKHLATDEAVSKIANILASSTSAKAIFATSLTGKTGRTVSRYRPETPMFVACTDRRVQRQLLLSWGVIPFILPPCKSFSELMKKGLAHVKKQIRLKLHDNIIVITGEPVGKSGLVNVVEIKEIL